MAIYVIHDLAHIVVAAYFGYHLIFSGLSWNPVANYGTYVRDNELNGIYVAGSLSTIVIVLLTSLILVTRNGRIDSGRMLFLVVLWGEAILVSILDFASGYWR